VPKTARERREFKLSTLESERAERVARFFVHARPALRTEDEPNDFMPTRYPEFGDHSPSRPLNWSFFYINFVTRLTIY
jgi:uncharacterized protein (DUF2384 family)